MNHLHASTELVVRNAMVEGLLFLRTQQPSRSMFEYKEVVGQIARLLVPTTAATAVNDWDQIRNVPWSQPSTIAEHPDNQKLFAALWSLIGAGYVFPRETEQARGGTYSVHIIRLGMTDKLLRLAANADAYPAHPGFIRRFRHATPTATDEVVAYLEDAVSCAEARLWRPALATVGVANEQTIRTAFDALDHLRAFPRRRDHGRADDRRLRPPRGGVLGDRRQARDRPGVHALTASNRRRRPGLAGR